ncbi:MAG: HEAT repeat domain-containing protein [bacterium]|nr:HEAT repeat domain-containing protein [bacterium]
MPDAVVIALITELVRAFKAMAFYPAGHPARQKFFARLLAGFADYLQRGGALDLSVGREGVVFSGEPVTAGDGSGQYLARECFERQVARLRFARGITAEDFGLLFDLLSTDPEALRAMGGALEFVRGRGSGSFTLEQVDYEGILERRVEATEDGQNSYGAEIRSPVAPPDSFQDQLSLNPQFELSEKMEVDQEEWLAGKLEELDRAVSVAGYRGVLKEILTGIRSTGGLEMPRYTCLVLKHLGRHLLAGAPEEILQMTRAAVVELGQPAAVEEFAVHLTVRDEPDRRAIQAVMKEVPGISIPVLLRRLAEETESFGRRVTIDTLNEFGDAMRPYLQKWLRDDRWYVIRNAMGLLQQVGGPQDSVNVRTFLEHPNSKVRLEALRFLYRYPTPIEDHLMDRLLSDEDSEVRARAVYALGVLQGRKGLARLMDLAAKPFAGEGDLTKREMAIKGLGREGGEEAISFLARCLTRRSLVNPSGGERIRKAVVDSLAEIGDARAAQVLRSSLRRLKGGAYKTAEDFLRRTGEFPG